MLFDKAGNGLSDPIPKVRLLEERAAEIEAVMDAVGFGKPVVFGMSEGGPQAIAFAAKRPERTRALILYGSFAAMPGGSWDDLDRDPAELRARVLAELGEDYTPSTKQIARMQEMVRAARSAWGSGATAKGLFPSVRSIRQLAMFERMCASPGMLRATLESNFRIDVRPILPTLTAPTLVIHAREDPMPVQSSRYLADHIPGARYLEVDGADHAPWFTEPDKILTEIEEFLTGSHAAPSQSHRALRTVLFTDIVASTQHAAATGDERWRAVLHRFGEITAELTQRFGGTVVKSTGDGHLATFDGPTQAIRCAEALRADAETLGIEIRAGIHTGECELLDADIGGIAVHIAARILGQAGAGEILVSRTVRDLVVGSGTGFEDRGSVELRGVPGTWQLLAVDRHGARAGSAEAELASMPTPGRRTAMRRSDRAVEVIARRHRGSCAGWPASPRPPAAAEQPESARLAPIAHEAIAGIERLVDDVIAATDPRAWQADASPAVPGVSQPFPGDNPKTPTSEAIASHWQPMATVNLMPIPDFQTMMRPVLGWQLREMNRNRLHRSGTWSRPC